MEPPDESFPTRNDLYLIEEKNSSLAVQFQKYVIQFRKVVHSEIQEPFVIEIDPIIDIEPVFDNLENRRFAHSPHPGENHDERVVKIGLDYIVIVPFNIGFISMIGILVDNHFPYRSFIHTNWQLLIYSVFTNCGLVYTHIVSNQANLCVFAS